MLSVCKFPLNVTERQEVVMPLGAKILTIQFQDFSVYMWALVEADSKGDFVEVFRKIDMYGTGHHMSDNPGKYLGTVQQGHLVWHFFEPLE